MSEQNEVTMTLKCILTDPEINAYARELARANKDLESTQQEKKSVAAQFKFREEEIGSQVSRLSGLIREGYEYRSVQCAVALNEPQQGKATVIRRDTGEIALVRDMTEDERQHSLPFEE